MTPLVLTLNLTLSFAALAALALSLDRHHRDAFLTRAPRARARTLRLAGWAGILASLAVAVAFEGWNFGPVQWIGALTGAALLVVVLLSYRPRWLRPAALAALPLALVALPFALRG
ncbi:DUF3325 domain-containing protein [Methylobacterium oxalidis]|uniref:Iron transporter n=1 Tax=Methylobacterium oxalidis TaxID=944322 RepID=A0A512IZV0_9HYPH|nr:DUF3325 domain-containing protein [Methylobacterium oxalidis]GEP03230.1 hypothetical protein MOX02_12680 [Methylobacterium oxalidis]GJE30829.1 hypothetical protein LDDCCGHA_0999 [Methylobacterium oxalidis]GLS67490.1 hypothetical protein GCM10007888_58740 [Methylobacterium oxalidis]